MSKKTDYDKVKLRTTHVGDQELPEKHIEPVVKGQVEKPGVGKWFSHVLFGDEGFRGATTRMIRDVVVPSIQNTVADVLVTAVQRAIFGDDYILNRRSNTTTFWGRGNNVTTRTNKYRGEQTDYTQNFSRRTHPSNVVHTITFDTQLQAQAAFDKVKEVIDQYDMVTVGDYYELTDNSHLASFTDHAYGWTTSSGGLRGSSIVPARDGRWKIQFPPPVEV